MSWVSLQSDIASLRTTDHHINLCYLGCQKAGRVLASAYGGTQIVSFRDTIGINGMITRLSRL